MRRTPCGRRPSPRQGTARSTEEAPAPDRLRAVLPQLPDPKRLPGAPGRTRTCDARFRKPTLYPSELRGRAESVERRVGRLAEAPHCLAPHSPLSRGGASSKEPIAPALLFVCAWLVLSCTGPRPQETRSGGAGWVTPISFDRGRTATDADIDDRPDEMGLPPEAARPPKVASRTRSGAATATARRDRARASVAWLAGTRVARSVASASDSKGRRRGCENPGRSADRSRDLKGEHPRGDFDSITRRLAPRAGNAADPLSSSDRARSRSGDAVPSSVRSNQSRRSSVLARRRLPCVRAACSRGRRAS